MGMPAFTGKQLAEWLYVKRVTDFADMTNISKQNRAESHRRTAAPPGCPEDIPPAVRTQEAG